MSTEFRMPKLGLTMDTGEVQEWLKTEGQPVSQGETLAVIITEKITNEIASPVSGTVLKILVPAGQEAPVGALLAIIGSVGEPISIKETVPTAPRDIALPLMAATDSAAPAKDNREIKATPVAKRLAKEHNVDLAQVKPSKGDHISREDVLAYLEGRQAQAQATQVVHPPQETPPVVAQPRYRVVPLAGMRKSIADHLVNSLRVSAQLSIANEVDFTALVQARELLLPGFQAATGIRLTYTDLLIALVAQALQQHPVLNSTLVGDEVRVHEDVNLGIAVAIEGGLIVPVIHQAQRLSLGQIAGARADLARRAQEGHLNSADLADGTFTISNPGMPGSDLSTPILNSPQNAILAIGRILKKPVVRDDQICIRQMSWLSLTFDHRVMDGIPVAAFLETLAQLIQQPMPVLSGGKL